MSTIDPYAFEANRRYNLPHPFLCYLMSFFFNYIAEDSNQKRISKSMLPEEYEKCLVGLNAITREAWNTSYTTEDSKEKIQALSLAKECYSMKLDLLTNATVVDDAMRFVCKHNNNNSPKLSSII
jgi:hypothetical protein